VDLFFQTLGRLASTEKSSLAKSENNWIGEGRISEMVKNPTKKQNKYKTKKTLTSLASAFLVLLTKSDFNLHL
jgi:hypothetical protein